MKVQLEVAVTPTRGSTPGTTPSTAPRTPSKTRTSRPRTRQRRSTSRAATSHSTSPRAPMSAVPTQKRCQSGSGRSARMSRSRRLARCCCSSMLAEASTSWSPPRATWTAPGQTARARRLTPGGQAPPLWSLTPPLPCPVLCTTSRTMATVARRPGRRGPAPTSQGPAAQPVPATRTRRTPGPATWRTPASPSTRTAPLSSCFAAQSAIARTTPSAWDSWYQPRAGRGRTP
mmetsp:Transcript_37617/g.117221  ORF Transcript_37617/g.117221 Transcript_37617/m.117221 type:complete len:231 (-) Transcript_37617:1064-1756(-)